MADYLAGSVTQEGARVTFTLVSKPTGSLRADAFVRELVAATVAVGHGAEGLRPTSFLRVEQRAE